MPDYFIEIGGTAFFGRGVGGRQLSGTGEYERGLLIRKALEDIGDEVRKEARRRAGKRSGALVERGIDETRVTKLRPSTWELRVGLRRHPRHGIWHHEGTGIYGAHRTPIFPARPGGVLRFVKPSGEVVYARWVRGQKPNPFMREAIMVVGSTYVPARLRMLSAELDRKFFFIPRVF